MSCQLLWNSLEQTLPVNNNHLQAAPAEVSYSV